MKALQKTLAKIDDLIDALGRHEGIALDRFGFLTDPIDATGALDETDDRPRQVIVDDT